MCFPQRMRQRCAYIVPTATRLLITKPFISTPRNHKKTIQLPYLFQQSKIMRPQKPPDSLLDDRMQFRHLHQNTYPTYVNTPHFGVSFSTIPSNYISKVGRYQGNWLNWIPSTDAIFLFRFCPNWTFTYS